MPEIRGSFGSADEWKAWRDGLGEFEEVRSAILDDIRTRGYVEPFTDIVRYPFQISIRDLDLNESVSCYELNSRKRALLMQIMIELQARAWLLRRDLRILGGEALSRIAMILRGKYPFYWGTEYLPNEEARLKYLPVPHLDVEQIEYPDESFDVFTSSDFFEHMWDVDRALEEIHRVLKPGGFIVASFPFDPSRVASLVKEYASEFGEALVDDPSEQQSDPAAEAEVVRGRYLAGWDLLPKLVSCGFEDAYISNVASSHFGVVSDSHLGVFVLTASKAGGKREPRSRPPAVIAKAALPEKLITLIALPRSGTTMLTAVFAVHSQCEAVYEPWNGKRISGDTVPSIEVIANVERLPNLAGKMLFVKETAAFHGSIPGMRKLYETAPFPVEKHMLMLLRQPEHTFLSEIERRKEWWKDDVTVNAESFDNWAQRSMMALRLMLDFGSANNGTAIILEDFAAQPGSLLVELAQRIGFRVEREQLEYEKHVDKRRVRGDLNVSKNPSKIAISFTESRMERAAIVDELVSASSFAGWFAAFRSLYAVIHEHGGIMSIREIPKPVIETLY